MKSHRAYRCTLATIDAEILFIKDLKLAFLAFGV
jgi:hypothetical protein